MIFTQLITSSSKIWQRYLKLIQTGRACKMKIQNFQNLLKNLVETKMAKYVRLNYDVLAFYGAMVPMTKRPRSSLICCKTTENQTLLPKTEISNQIFKNCQTWLQCICFTLNLNSQGSPALIPMKKLQLVRESMTKSLRSSSIAFLEQNQNCQKKIGSRLPVRHKLGCSTQL